MYIEKKISILGKYVCFVCLFVCLFNTTFNNISVISWRSVLLEEETGESHQHVASYWQTITQWYIEDTTTWTGFELNFNNLEYFIYKILRNWWWKYELFTVKSLWTTDDDGHGDHGSVELKMWRRNIFIPQVSLKS
jgi:hypothetical protein